MGETIPTMEQMGELVIEVNKLLGKRERTKNKLDITEYQLIGLETGTRPDTRLYISFFVLAMRRLVPRKIRLKQLPSNFPSKDKIIEMLNGKCENCAEYAELVSVLLTLPDLPTKPKKKKHHIVCPEKRPKKTQKDWGKDALMKEASKYSRKSYGMETQITRKAWGSALSQLMDDNILKNKTI